MAEPSTRTPGGLAFTPNPFMTMNMPHFQNNNLLRYLFRVSDCYSAGTTTSVVVTAPASKTDASNTRELFDHPLTEVAERLYAHFEGTRSHENSCNLMSWTSSLLSALQYGIYRRHKHPDSPVYVLVLDTRGFPKGTFIQELELIKFFHEQHEQFGTKDELRKFFDFRSGKLYFGEYLTQGRTHIQSTCAMTTMQELIDDGLFEFEPRLGDDRKSGMLAKRVVELRELFDIDQDGPSKEVHSEIERAMSIARTCFGAIWALPMTLMLLALRPRWKDAPVIADMIIAKFSEAQINDLKFRVTTLETEGLPEVQQFEKLIYQVRARAAGADVECLFNPFERMILGRRLK